MIIADLYVERSFLSETKPRTILIWSVYARSDKEVARILAHYIPDQEDVKKLIKKAHTEGRAAIRHRRDIADNIQSECWIMITPNLSEVSKIWLEIEGWHQVKPQYGMEEAYDVSKFAKKRNK